VALHDLAWLLPRTVDPEAEANLDGLPGSELEVMRLLVRRPGSSVGEVARELGLAPSNASATVRALIARGLLERRADPDDGRVSRLEPTPRATEIRRRREQAWARALEKRLERLSAADARRLLASGPALRALAGELGRGPTHRDA
jgi:DNA-binding MarR family transcriptional regulator